MFAPANPFGKLEKKHFDKVALIDADKMKHLVANDVRNDLLNDIPRNPKRLADYIEKRVSDIFKEFSAKGYIFCFSGKSYDTFRNAVSFEKQYKGNRKDDPSFYEGKIEDMAECTRVVMQTYPSLLYPDLEADDILCFLQNEDTFIFSNDKDLKQIPGNHYCVIKREVITITEEEAFRNLCYQLIIGDTTDNITGLKGYGPKKAEKIIEDVPLKSLINRILFEYQTVHGITKGTDCFVETWNLVKLRVHRGAYFMKKYESAKNLLEMVILNAK